MKVGAGGITALANRSDNRTTFDLFALFHLDPLEVGVAGLVPAIMFDNNEAAEISRTACKNRVYTLLRRSGRLADNMVPIPPSGRRRVCQWRPAFSIY